MSKGGHHDMRRSSWSCRSMICASFLIAVTSPFAEETDSRSYSLPDHGSLQLQVPPLWVDQLRQPAGQLPPTITFSQKSGNSFRILMTPLWAANKESVLPDGDKLRHMVHESADQTRAQAVERSIDVVEIIGTSGVGFYFSATDQAPKPGEYKYMTQGIIRIGELMTTFTILTNEGQGDIASKALMMLKTAKHNKGT
jgi:hypothetical protein